MLNKTMLIGRLTKDPELKRTPNGIATLRFTLAVNRTVTSSKGEKTADFINCIAWRAQAENMAKYLKKGSQVLVDGRIETGSYTVKDGTTKFTTDIVASSVQFLDNRAESSQAVQPTQPIPFPQQQQQAQQPYRQQVSNPYQQYPQQPQSVQQPTWQPQQAVGQNQWIPPQQQPTAFNEADLSF